MDFQPHGQFESPVLKRLSSVQAFSETRSAYYAVCWLLRRDHEPYDALSPVSRTRRRSPEVSSTAFPARPPNLPPRPLMTMDFAISCSSGRVALVIRFLSIVPQVCSTLPSDFASRRRPCASLTLRRHQAGYRTFTSKLSNMLVTQQKSRPVLPGGLCFCRFALFAVAEAARPPASAARLVGGRLGCWRFRRRLLDRIRFGLRLAHRDGC
jgi:hypothetical protein